MKLTTEELKAAKAYAKKHGHQGRKGGAIVDKRGKTLAHGWAKYYDTFLSMPNDPDPILPKDWGKIATSNESEKLEIKMSAVIDNDKDLAKHLTGKWTIGAAHDDAIDLLRRVEDYYWEISRNPDKDYAQEELVDIVGDIHRFLRSQ